MDAPGETMQPSAATRITSGGRLLFWVSTPFAGVPGSMPPSSCAPTGTTKRMVHNMAKAAPGKETAGLSPALFRDRNDSRCCGRPGDDALRVLHRLADDVREILLVHRRGS